MSRRASSRDGVGGFHSPPSRARRSLYRAVVRPLFVLASAVGGLAVVSPAITSVHAQEARGTASITGAVTDSSTEQPLGAVQVSVVGTRRGASTDEAGRFTIGGLAAGTYTVEFRRLGYKPSTRTGVVVADGDKVTLNLRLVAATLTLEAVVTTGVVDPTTGTRVPFTVGHVDAANAPVPAGNALETIQGKIAGVTVVPTGQAGGGTNILLRSPTSINKSNSPLIVVDGVIQAQSFDAASADLESMDIESVEVVKGAAAASLYGSRAEAGVIQIRTKRGSNLPSGKTRIHARTEVGANDLSGKIDWAHYNYYQLNDQGKYVNNAGTVVERSGRVPDSVFKRFQDNVYPDPIYDQVARFFHPGNTYKNSASIAQNNGNTNWMLSLVNSREDGVVLNKGAYNQNDLRLNLDHQFREDLRLSVSTYHSQSTRQNLYGDTFFDLINQGPDVDLRKPDPDGTPYIFQADPSFGREENPLYVLATEDRMRYRSRTQGSLEARYTPLSWLSFDGNVSYDRSDRRSEYFLDAGMKTEGAGTSAGGPGEISQATGTTNALNASLGGNVLGRVGALTLRSTLRTLIEREEGDNVTASGSYLTAPGVKSLDNAQQRSVASDNEAIRSAGYFLTGGADYAGRYIFDGLIRRDGSSLFGPDERWHYYYRASASWRMAEESWWPFKSITEFKPRISQGTAGGRPDFSDQYETYALGDAGRVTKSTLGNKNLKPERSRETEFGIDAIVQGRYSVQLTYAKNHVTDQLIQIPLAALFGYTSQWQNAGTIDGNTYEASFEAQLLNRRDLKWRMGLVGDRSRNKISEFNRPCMTVSTIAYRCAGETLGAMYGFQFLNNASQLPADAKARAGEFQVNDDGLLVWVGPNHTFKEGESSKLWGTSSTIGAATYNWGMPINRVDSTGAQSVVHMGDGNPKFHLGLSNNVEWRRFSFYGLVDMNVGGQVYNQTKQRMYQYGISADVDQVGKPQELKKTVDYYVALYDANNPVNYFVENAGFVKLRELSVKYRLGGPVLRGLSRIGADAASIGVVGRNLLTFTGYTGYDPEVGNGIVRLDSFGYPRYRTITGTLELTF